jgi:hypothetical protein
MRITLFQGPPFRTGMPVTAFAAFANHCHASHAYVLGPAFLIKTHITRSMFQRHATLACSLTGPVTGANMALHDDDDVNSTTLHSHCVKKSIFIAPESKFKMLQKRWRLRLYIRTRPRLGSPYRPPPTPPFQEGKRIRAREEGKGGKRKEGKGIGGRVIRMGGTWPSI